MELGVGALPPGVPGGVGGVEELGGGGGELGGGGVEPVTVGSGSLPEAGGIPETGG